MVDDPRRQSRLRMRFLSATAIAVRALCVHKFQSVLTMIGVTIGVAAVITSAAIGVGAQEQVDQQIQGLGTNLLIVYPGAYSAAGVRLGAGTRATLTDDDAHAIETELWEIEAAAPVLQGRGQVVFERNNWATGYLGVTPEFFHVRGWKVAAGSAFDHSHVAAASKVVMLGETVAHHLFGEADPVGNVIRIGKVPMRVIGVLQRKGQSLQAQDQDDLIIMPITTLRNRVVGGSRAKLRLLNSISVKVQPGSEAAAAQAEIRTLLRQRHRLQPAHIDDFTIRNLSEAVEAREEAAFAMAVLLATVGGVALLVGGIGIMNMMLAAVAERTREIGLRMAVGARRRDILSQFLIEAVTISLIGAACGVLLGAGASFVIGYFAGWHAPIGLPIIGLAMGFAVTVGGCFGFIPAYRASRLVPVAALRAE